MSYDLWKTTPPDDDDGDVCDQCGGYLRRGWPSGWFCEPCDDENEYRQQQLEEQESREQQFEEQS